MPMPICRRLFRHLIRLPFSLAVARAGNSNPARMAMIAMTTSNSMRVKARNLDKTELALMRSFLHTPLVGPLSLVSLPVVGPDDKPLKGHSWIGQELSRSIALGQTFFCVVLWIVLDCRNLCCFQPYRNTLGSRTVAFSKPGIVKQAYDNRVKEQGDVGGHRCSQ